jgi:hypothetical protein
MIEEIFLGRTRFIRAAVRRRNGLSVGLRLPHLWETRSGFCYPGGWFIRIKIPFNGYAYFIEAAGRLLQG